VTRKSASSPESAPETNQKPRLARGFFMPADDKKKAAGTPAAFLCDETFEPYSAA
jgi:hypothetical protein